MLEFTRTNIASIKGLQPSKYDFLLENFVEPGDAIEIEEAQMPRQTASVLAKRFKTLTGKPFHSFFNVQTKKVTIRVRPDGEIPDKEDKAEEE